MNLAIDCMLNGWETTIFITTSELRKRNVQFSHLAGTGKHSLILRWVEKKYSRKSRDPEIKEILIDPETGEEKFEQSTSMVLKYIGTVWNIELFSELMEEFAPQASAEIAEDGNGKIEQIEQMVEEFFSIPNAPSFTEISGRAAYSLSEHNVNAPPISDFKNNESYYDVKFHEMAHSTGHESLLARRSLEKIKKKGDHAYSQEELVAEFTGCFLDAETGIDKPEIIGNSAAYLQGWWDALDKDEGMLARAICNDQKAFYMIMGIQKDKTEETA